jgi:hypothetical protein
MKMLPSGNVAHVPNKDELLQQIATTSYKALSDGKVASYSIAFGQNLRV